MSIEKHDFQKVVSGLISSKSLAMVDCKARSSPFSYLPCQRLLATSEAIMILIKPVRPPEVAKSLTSVEASQINHQVNYIQYISVKIIPCRSDPAS